MKKSIFLFVVILLSGLSGLAQNYNLVIFSDDGDAFYAIVNGIRQNDKPETNIKITGLTAEALSVRIEFKDAALPKLKQNMMGEPGFEHTVRIKKNTKKEMKLQYFGKVALNEAPKSSGSTVAYHTSESAVSDSGTETYNTSTNTNGSFNEGDGGTTVTKTSTSTKATSNPDNVSLNINMGGAGINMNLSGLDGTEGTMTSTSSTTVTTTSSSSSSGGVSKNNSTTSNTAVEPVTTTKSGCASAMSAASFESMKKSIADKPFSDTKMSTAKVATKNSCLSVSQVKQICGLFNMDDEKLTYAKFAYNYCVDKGNYYKVSEAFSFSATTEDLNKFLEEN